MQEKQEMQVQSLGQEDPLEKEMATHSRILAFENSMDRVMMMILMVTRTMIRMATTIYYAITTCMMLC